MKAPPGGKIWSRTFGQILAPFYHQERYCAFSPISGSIACKDRTIKLLDYNARYYDPYLNRFASADTIVPDSANPQSLNRYSYVYNNPLRYTDPSGHGIGDWLVELGRSGPVGKALVVGMGEVVHHVNRQNQKIFYPDENTSAGDRLLACVEIGGGSVVFAAAATEVLFGTLTTAAATGGVTEVTATGVAAERLLGADGDYTNEARAAGNIIDRTWTVLGKYPGYLQKAREYGANALNIPDDEWAALGTWEAQWARNVEFLDDAIARGDAFYLETSFAQGIRDGGSFFQSELLYLLEQGYELVIVHGQEWLVPTQQVVEQTAQ